MRSKTIHRILPVSLLVNGLLGMGTSRAVAQSFDCQKAITLAEKSVCADTNLSKLDDRMARLFAGARGAGHVDAIGQRAWLKNVRDRCRDVACLTDAYRTRIAYLENPGPAAAFTMEGLAGEWNRSSNTQHDRSFLVIDRVGPTDFQFELSAVSGANTGVVDGVAIKEAARALFKAEETGCLVTFRRTANRFFVATSDECSSMGGTGVTFDGEYGRGQAEGPAPTLTALGVLARNVPEEAFVSLVGKDYPAFVFSFHLLYRDDDLDGLGTQVVSGAVRGLFTLNEAIVMSGPDGSILAAVIDDDEIRYFSNHRRFKAKLPATIDKWRQGFPEKKVVFVHAR